MILPTHVCMLLSLNRPVYIAMHRRASQLYYTAIRTVDFTILDKSMVAVNNPVGVFHRFHFPIFYGIPYWRSVGSIGQVPWVPYNF